VIAESISQIDHLTRVLMSQRTLSGVKRTFGNPAAMSAFDPKRTSRFPRAFFLIVLNRWDAVLARDKYSNDFDR
jgi:hypothetical protein